MNTNQVVPMASGARISRKASVLDMKTKSDYKGKGGSFDDALAKSKGDSLTLQDVKDLAKSAEAAEKEAKIAEAVESAGTEANAPKDNGSRGENADKAASANSKTAKQEPNNEVAETIDANGQTDAAVLSLVLQNADNTDNVNINGGSESADVKTESVDIAPKSAANYNLQTILPQSTELAGKNREMLAMLSGQHIPKQEGKIDLNELGLKNIDPENLTKPDGNLNDASTFAKGQSSDPLTLIANDMAKNAKTLDVNSLEKPIANVAGENAVNVDDFANSKNLANVRIVENAKTIVNNIGVDNAGNLSNANIKNGGGAATDFVEAEAKPENIEIKTQVKAEAAQEFVSSDAKSIKNVEAKAQPVLTALQNAKPANENAVSNPLAGITVEADDADVLPIREAFGGFGQNSDGDEKQSLFNNNQDEVIIADNAEKQGAEKTENNGQFAHALETRNAQHTTNARETAPATSLVRDDYNVREQIVQQARLIRAENGQEIVIRLRPEHLGEMTLRISVSSEGSVTASFYTNNAEVRHIVENSLVQLRQELQNQGIKVDKTEVYSGLSDGNLPQGQGQEAWQHGKSGASSGGRFADSEAGAAQFENISAETSAGAGATSLTDGGVDYLV